MHKLNWSRAQFSSPNPCITSCVIQTLIQIHSQACRASAFCFTHPWKLIFLLAQCLPCRFHSQHTQAFSPLWSSACALSSPPPALTLTVRTVPCLFHSDFCPDTFFFDLLYKGGPHSTPLHPLSAFCSLTLGTIRQFIIVCMFTIIAARINTSGK